MFTWIAEAGPTHSILEEDGTHRFLRAHVPGYMASAPAAWLGTDTAVVPVSAHGPRQGPAVHRESGYRGDLALLDIVADTMWLITAVPDGEYLRVEGLIARDTLLVGMTGSGWPQRHATLPVHGGSLDERLALPGRAAAHRGCIALLRPLPDEGHLTEWELLLFGHEPAGTPHGRFRGHELRLLWHHSARRLAVAQESELPGGYRTLILEVD